MGGGAMPWRVTSLFEQASLLAAAAVNVYWIASTGLSKPRLSSARTVQVCVDWRLTRSEAKGRDGVSSRTPSRVKRYVTGPLGEVAGCQESSTSMPCCARTGEQRGGEHEGE